jgi:GT2 family glycosyltransferase
LKNQTLERAIVEILVVGLQSGWTTIDDRIRYIFNEQASSSRNRNIGSQKASAEWICFLDSDCIPDQEWLEMLDASIQRGEIATAGSVLIPSTHGYWSWCDYLAGFFNQNPVLSHKEYLIYSTMTNFVIRRDIFLDIGGFDESLSTTGEDREFCWRLAKRGYKIFYARNAEVLHSHARNSFRQTWNHLFNFGKGTAWFRLKYIHDTPWSWKIGYSLSKIRILGEVVGIMRVLLAWIFRLMTQPKIFHYWIYLPGAILLNIAHTLGMIYTLRTYAPKN